MGGLRNRTQKLGREKKKKRGDESRIENWQGRRSRIGERKNTERIIQGKDKKNRIGGAERKEMRAKGNGKSG